MATRRRGPTLSFESRYWDTGAEVVVGIDEVGRGAWAGPLTLAAVVLPRDRRVYGVRDSKQLTEARREQLFDRVVQWCDGVGVGHVDHDECDELGMSSAQRLAARRALASLGLAPDVVLVDGPWDFVNDGGGAGSGVDDGGSQAGSGVDDGDDTARVDSARVDTARVDTARVDSARVDTVGVGGAPVDARRWQCGDPVAVETIVKGDARCLSIAAASIVAKVTRDRLMRGVAESYPAFNFERNKGYPCPRHKFALKGYGPTPLHRHSWAFMDNLPWLTRRTPPVTAQEALFELAPDPQLRVTGPTW